MAVEPTKQSGATNGAPDTVVDLPTVSPAAADTPHRASASSFEADEEKTTERILRLPESRQFFREGQEKFFRDLVALRNEPERAIEALPQLLQAAAGVVGQANPEETPLTQLGLVVFLGCGAITAASVWLHRWAHPESLEHLVGLARESSGTAREVMIAGTNTGTFHSSDIKINVKGDHTNLIALTDDPAKTMMAHLAKMIFLNLKFKDLMHALDNNWIQNVSRDVEALPTFVKSFEDSHGHTVVEALEQKFLAAGREDLINKVAILAGYTSSVKIIQGKEVYHLEIVVRDQSAGESIRDFFVTQGIEPTINPLLEGTDEANSAPNNYYAMDHLAVTLTVGDRDTVQAAALGGAAKNILILQTGYDIFTRYLNIASTTPVNILNQMQQKAEERRNQDQIHLQKLYQWEGLSAKPSRGVIEDILLCSQLDYTKLIELAKKVRKLVASSDVLGLKALIQQAQSDQEQPYGSRNSQVGVYLAIANYAKKHGLIDYVEEIFNPSKPENWTVQEGVPGIKNLWKRAVLLGAPLPYGVKPDSPRARAESLPQHFQETKSLVFPLARLPNSYFSLVKDHEGVQRGLSAIIGDLRSPQASFEQILIAMDNIFLFIQNNSNEDPDFQKYITNVHSMILSMKILLKKNDIEYEDITKAKDIIRESLELFVTIPDKIKEHELRMGALAEFKNGLRLACQILARGKDFLLAPLTYEIYPPRPYTAPEAQDLRSIWHVAPQFLEGYDELDNVAKIARPWGLPAPWVNHLGSIVVNISAQITAALTGTNGIKKANIRGQLERIEKILGPLNESTGSNQNITKGLMILRGVIGKTNNNLKGRKFSQDDLNRIVKSFQIAISDFSFIFTQGQNHDEPYKILHSLQTTLTELIATKDFIKGFPKIPKKSATTPDAAHTADSLPHLADTELEGEALRTDEPRSLFQHPEMGRLSTVAFDALKHHPDTFLFEGATVLKPRLSPAARSGLADEDKTPRRNLIETRQNSEEKDSEPIRKFTLIVPADEPLIQAADNSTMMLQGLTAPAGFNPLMGLSPLAAARIPLPGSNVISLFGR